MKRIYLVFFVILGLIGSSLYAQERRVTGTVTDNMDGSSLPGVSVFIKGTTQGTVTDANGRYEINVASGATLVFSFIGMVRQEIVVGDQTVINVALRTDISTLQEVIVSGVAAGTPRAKMSVSVARVGSEALEDVPAQSAATALQGKVSGVTVTQSAGSPGQSATIIIRGATQMVGSQDPLIIVDGVMVDGTLADINVDDIESIEVVKGASASALYGSRAGNGVIVITTKSGKTLKEGQTIVRIRNEVGQTELSKKYELAQSHMYVLADDWQSQKNFTKYAGVNYPAGYAGGNAPGITGSRIVSPDNYMDKPYARIFDHQSDLFGGNEFMTNYVSVEGNLGQTSFMTSFENSKQGGVISIVDGYARQNYRLNLNHRVNDKLTVGASNLYSKSSTKAPGGANLFNGGIFFNLLLMHPDVDLRNENVDGQPYQFIPDNWNVTTENPLYNIWKQQNNEVRDRLISNFSARYTPFDWLDFEAKYAFENQNTTYDELDPYDTYQRAGGVPQYSEGRLYKYASRRFDETMQTTANLHNIFGDLTMKARMSYLYERRYFESSWARGRRFAYNIPGLITFDNIADAANITAGNNTTEEVTKNYFGIVSLDYKDRYILDGMYRMDGSSLFGSEERWNPYYRISGAYRITEDLSIPGFRELKVRAAYGTAGQRPGFLYQYETMGWTAFGVVEKETLGNNRLKPSRSKEWEVGLEAFFLDRFDFEATYSVNTTEDQFVRAPQAVHAGGWSYQWINGGTMEAKAIEMSLGAQIHKTRNFDWSARLMFDKVLTQITQLDIPSFQYGPQGQEADKLFLMATGEKFGTMYGYRFLRSLDEMAKQLGANQTIDMFEINSDGYVVPAGTQGTNFEVPQVLRDANGQPAVVKIGDGTPDFNLKLTTNMRYKDFTLYMLWDWKQGGDIYNKTAQWLTRDNRWAKMDQSGKPENEKKTVNYYKGFYYINEMNDYWVEDGSFLKLRELSLYYNLRSEKLSNVMGGYLKGVRIGVIGRNLLTFTKYSGYDPEVQTWNSGGVQYYPYDFAGYPNYRSYSGSIELRF